MQISTPEQIEQAERELCRRSLLPFVQRFKEHYEPGWVHREIARELEQFVRDVEDKKSPRLAITVPPRHGKSTLSTICLPAWCLLKHPDWDVITGCYSQDLAADFGEEVSGIILSPEYKALDPEAMIGTRLGEKKGKVDKTRFSMVAGGKYRAVGVGTGATGRGARIFVCDDPYKGPEEADSLAYQKRVLRWYYAVALTRLAPGGGILLVMTRWGVKDLVGELIQTGGADANADQWRVIEYPAIAKHDEPHRKAGEALHPERYPVEYLAKLRASYIAAGQSRIWNSLYQCNPTPDEGIFFRSEWFKTYDKVPKGLTWYGCTDWAIGSNRLNDFTVIWCFGVDEDGDLYFAPSMYRERGSSGMQSVIALKEMMRKYEARECAYDFTIIGKSLEDIVRSSMGKVTYTDKAGKKQTSEPWYFSLWKFSPTKDKATHAAALRALMEAGKVHFPAGVLLEETVKPEFTQFLGGGAHDDIVDACSWAAIHYHDLLRRSAHAKPKPVKSDAEKRLAIVKARGERDDDEDRGAYRPLFG